MSGGPILVWMWKFGALYVKPFATLAEAVDYATETEEATDGILELIEGATPDELAAEHERRDVEAAATRAASDAARRAGQDWLVQVLSPKPENRARGEWRTTGGITDKASAEGAAVEIARTVGDGRVRVKRA